MKAGAQVKKSGITPKHKGTLADVQVKRINKTERKSKLYLYKVYALSHCQVLVWCDTPA